MDKLAVSLVRVLAIAQLVERRTVVDKLAGILRSAVRLRLARVILFSPLSCLTCFYNLKLYSGMDITCLYTSFWEFICDSGCPAVPRHVGRNYVPLLCNTTFVKPLYDVLYYVRIRAEVTTCLRRLIMLCFYKTRRSFPR